METDFTSGGIISTVPKVAAEKNEIYHPKEESNPNIPVRLEKQILDD